MVTEVCLGGVVGQAPGGLSLEELSMTSSSIDTSSLSLSGRGVFLSFGDGIPGGRADWDAVLPPGTPTALKLTCGVRFFTFARLWSLKTSLVVFVARVFGPPFFSMYFLPRSILRVARESRGAPFLVPGRPRLLVDLPDRPVLLEAFVIVDNLFFRKLGCPGCLDGILRLRSRFLGSFDIL